MFRVLLGAMSQESDSFVPGVTGLESFGRRGLFEGEDLFRPARGSRQETDGILQVSREHDVDLIPTISARSMPGPPVSDAAYAYIKSRILEGARAHRGRLDGVALVLHGAMLTESLDHPEEDLIGAVREIVGPGVPIAVSYDMHCYLGDREAGLADVMAAYHTQPHRDVFDTGVRAMRLLVRAMKREIRPVSAERRVRMITSAEKHVTDEGPMAEILSRALEMETEPGILSVSVLATQPWLDVAGQGWKIVVNADGDRELAQKRADELALMCWERRERFLVERMQPREAVERALAGPGQPYVLTDASDGVTGGSHGDGNVLLRTLLEMGYRDTALLTLTDSEATAACMKAGVGAEVTLPVGGKLTPQFFKPVMVTGRVKRLGEGKYMAELPPSPMDVGHVAVLEVGGISLLLTEHPASTYDAEAYHCAGLEPKDFKIVQVKSQSGYRTVYGRFAVEMMSLDIPGPTDSDLERLPFKYVERPLWPLDRDLAEPW